MAYAIVFCFSLLLFRASYKSNNGFKSYNRFVVFSVVILLCLFSSLRGMDVGSDTRTYYYHFVTLSYSSFDQVLARYKTDSGFYIFTWILSRLLGNYQLYLTIVALIYIIPIIELIKRKSSLPVFSLYLFFCLGLYTFSFSTIRQTIAMCFCLMAYLNLDKNKIRAIVLFVVGVTFHYSAIIFLPFFFLDRVNLTKKKVGIMSGCVAIAYLLSDRLIPYITSVANYSGTNKTYKIVSTGGIGMIAFLFFVFIVGSYTVMSLDHNNEEENKVCKEQTREVMFVYAALLVFIVSRFNMAVMRLYYYYFCFSIITIPNIVNNQKNRNNKTIFMLVFILVALYFLFFQVFNDPYSEATKLLPYKFFWQ